MCFHKNCNSKRQMYTIQHLKKETGKTFEAYR